MTEVYQPREDTYLLLECMEEYAHDENVILEVGTGSGYVVSNLESELTNSKVIGSDISTQSAIEASRRTGCVVVSNLANCFRENSLDVIGFNLPYLSQRDTDDELDRRALSYNKGLLKDYVEEAERCLKNNGVCVFVVSNKTPENPASVVESSSFRRVEVRTKKSFFENINAFVCRLNC